MMQAIAKRDPNEIQEQKRPLVMRSGLVHWLTPKTAENIEKVLATQTAHGFIRINELGITINSADVGDGILTIAQYNDLVRKKQGDWQCEDGNWHTKKERSCTCKEDRMTAARREAEARKREEENKPLTPAQEKRRKEKLKRTGEELVLKGIIPHVGRTIRRSTLEEWKESGQPLAVSEESLKIDEDVL